VFAFATVRALDSCIVASLAWSVSVLHLCHVKPGRYDDDDDDDDDGCLVV